MYSGNNHFIGKIKTKCIQKTLNEAEKDVLFAFPFLFCANSRSNFWIFKNGQTFYISCFLIMNVHSGVTNPFEMGK